MDAETRHELKTNRLYETLLKLKEWLDKWLNVILIGITILFLSIAAWRWWSGRQQSAVDKAWGVIAETRVESTDAGDQPLEELRGLVDSGVDPTVVAVARIRLADGLAYRATGPTTTGKLADAEKELNAVINTTEVNPLIRAAAIYRLACVHESQGKFDAAKSTYERLKDPAFANSPFQNAADERIASLAALPKDVPFLPGAAPVEAPKIPEPASAPASGPATAPASSPASAETPAEGAPASAPGPGSQPAPGTQPASAPGSGS